MKTLIDDIATALVTATFGIAAVSVIVVVFFGAV
jgi:hypothetical protein